MKNTRTNTYCFSVVNSDGGRVELENLRKEVKIFNAEERLKELKDPSYEGRVRKVAVFDRLGKNNPNAAKYRAANKGWRNAYARIRIADAATLDVYMAEFQKVTYSSWRNDGTFTKGLRHVY